LFDLSHPFFKPLWTRVVIAAGLDIWAIFEFATLELFWGILFGALGIWCTWQFFFTDRFADSENGDGES